MAPHLSEMPSASAHELVLYLSPDVAAPSTHWFLQCQSLTCRHFQESSPTFLQWASLALCILAQNWECLVRLLPLAWACSTQIPSTARTARVVLAIVIERRCYEGRGCLSEVAGDCVRLL